MTEFLEIIPARMFNGFAAVSLLFIHALISRIFRESDIEKSRFFLWVALGWFMNLLYLGSPDFAGGNQPVTELLIWSFNAMNYAAFLTGSRWYSKILRRLIGSRARIAVLFILLLIIATLTTVSTTRRVAAAILVVVGAGAIATVSYNFHSYFVKGKTTFRPITKLLIVYPLAAYALLQFAAFFTTYFTPDAPPVRTHVALLIGTGLKISHLIGLVEYAAQVFQASERRVVANSDADLIRRVAEQLSHELNTPALDLHLRAEALSRTGSQHQGIEAAQRAVEQIQGAVASYQDFFGEHKLQGSLTPQRINVNVACDQAIVTIKSTLRPKVIFRRNYSRGMEVTVVASELQQILRNLLKNAVEALAAARVTPAIVSVQTALAYLSPDHAVVTITIADTGPGVPADQQKLIFQEGFTTKPGRGRGHGLAIAMKLATRAGGSLQFIPAGDAPYEGAAFRVLLPSAGDGADRPSEGANHA
jgi:signal transduction histidine kinase